ncbi:serine/threonine-protein kinase [Nocardioides sp. T2.26MG-1]|uniref:serine/threonine-protein kinase n=1 Tax=Nocardioides sp. T2.26MG-1 TaxID=3041166 RepID=UPI002477A86A|nr:serine/threonine-protein kinase [Nocardioides sp. T2.26MG-1]CAI9415436.1 Serine/threonine-protein kinase PknD [Nocardioides sp. T2.26MG-1]
MSEVFARRYELLDPIAEGGMGSVWLVRDQEDGQVKVAKLLRHSDAGSLLRFMREQSTRIHHPHVVTPISWAGEDDTVLFTMPLVRGGSVATLVGDWGPLPEAWVGVVLEQTLSALEAVHAARVVHRDVKPANLLLEPTGAGRPHVRLTDFGIAVPVDQPRMTLSSTTLGTPGYMAPEQLLGGDPDPRQDLYAAAMVGLEMLVGHPPPFHEEEMPATPLGRLLARSGDPDPDRRPATASAMLDELRTTLPPAAWNPGEVEVLDHFEGRFDGTASAVQPGPLVAATSVLHVADTTSRPRGGSLPIVVLVVLGVLLLTLSALLLLR